MNDSSIAGSAVTMLPSIWRCGHNSTAMTPPTTHSLASPLAKFASACFENRRAKPAIGEIRDSCGLTDSVVHDVAGESGDAQHQKRQAESGGDIEGERRQRRAAPSVGI